MDEERNDRTIGNLRTRGAAGPSADEELRKTGTECMREAAQTMGGMETIGPEEASGALLLAGRYKVVRRLGEGGMGSVWLAEDTKLDGRLVAIKMLPAVLAGKKRAYRQVKQEALVAMKLSHPNIATVRAFEEDEGGSPFLVMDYIEGEGLDEILSEREPLGEAETLEILGPVAAALDYAHSQGVVHRDVKPGNVMVRKDGTPFVLDFGIAREIQETMTRVTGKFSSGTLLYMSPEQLRGRAPKAAQDVYSFAAMAYECLAGHPPFYRGCVEDQIKNEPPEELPEDAASEPLQKSVIAGLAKEPEQRPGTCTGVLGDATGNGIGIREFPTAGIGQKEERKGNGKEGNAEGDGEVFLLKIRLEKALGSAEKENATREEQAQLAEIREFSSAGEEALRRGRDAVAAALFAQGEKAMESWRNALSVRLERERAVQAEALALEAEIAGALDGALAEFSEAMSAFPDYRDGEQARKEGNSALAEGRFTEAKEKLEQAKRMLGGALADARAERARRRVESAEELREAEEWEKCLEMADAALADDGENPDAERLKEEAERHLKPTILLRATVDGMEVDARVTDGLLPNGQKTPVIVILEPGESHAFSLEYATEEKTYRGRTTVPPKKRGQTEVTVALEEEIPGRTRIVALPGGAAMELVWCPPGRFTMGSPENEAGREKNERQHEVTLTEGFWLAKHAVTQAQWTSVMGYNPSQHRDASQPVENVSWEDCRKFCEMAGLRLPTEAQWEYACRAGATGPYGKPRPGDSGEPQDMGWFGGNEYGGLLHPVGEKQPNAWGLHDMHGNVWEWCSDWYTEDLGRGAVTDPSGPPSGKDRVLRGGCALDDALGCRSAIRNCYAPNLGDGLIGFRPLAL